MNRYELLRKDDTMKRAIRLTLALSLLGTTSAWGTPVLAECSDNSANRWPAFEDVAPSARRVIVGTVVDSARVDQTESSTVFSVEVDDVLTGEAPAVIEVNGLKSGLPLRGEKTCRRSSNLYATLGDRIAIAFGGKVPGVKGRVNSAAWIEGGPHPVANPGLGGARLDDVRRLVGLEPLPSFRALLSGRDATIAGDTVVLDGVAVVAWLTDTPSPSVGQWDVTTFLAGWNARRAVPDAPRALLRLADTSGAWDGPIEVREVAADGLGVRIELAVEPRQGMVARGGPTTLFLEIDDDPQAW